MSEPAAAEEFPWPTTGGIWMAWIEELNLWFPYRTLPLRDDLPTRDELAFYAAHRDRSQLRKILDIVAQFHRAPGEMPYTFQGCHPCDRWRRPDPEELKRARHFYGVSAT